MSLRLHTFRYAPSPLKARLALAELGLDYQSCEVDLLKGEQRSEEFKKINPHGRLPVLEDGSLILRESSAIVTYLGRKCKDKWPRDPQNEAIALQWLFFESAHLITDCGLVWWTDVLAPAAGREATEAAIVSQSITELETPLNLLESHLENNKFILGDEFSMVDCVIGVTVAMLRGTRLDDGKQWPTVVAYRERIRNRPSWAAAKGNQIHEFDFSNKQTGKLQ